jgi:hypothetical protein
MLLDLRQYGMGLQLPEALLIRGQTLVALTQLGPAQACLEEARPAAEATGARHVLGQILLELNQLETGFGAV